LDCIVKKERMRKIAFTIVDLEGGWLKKIRETEYSQRKAQQFRFFTLNYAKMSDSIFLSKGSS